MATEKTKQGVSKKARRLTPKQLDTLIGSLWHTHASGVQVRMMDLPNIFRDVREAFVVAGCPTSDEAEAVLIPAIQAAITTYRTN